MLRRCDEEMMTGQLGARGKTELAKYRCEVVLHRLDRHEQLLGGFAVRDAFGDGHTDTKLLRSQPSRGRCRRADRFAGGPKLLPSLRHPRFGLQPVEHVRGRMELLTRQRPASLTAQPLPEPEAGPSLRERVDV